jgi:hypothetical protein
MQNIERQLEALYRLRDFIFDFRQQLFDSVQAYNNMVFRLKEVGIPREIADNYEANYYTDNIRLLVQIVEIFSEVDIRYIDANIFALEQALDEATGASYVNKVPAFQRGVENIKRKMENEQEMKNKQTQIIAEIKKKVHIEDGLDSVKQHAAELSAVEEQQKINNDALLYWLKQNQK